MGKQTKPLWYGVAAVALGSTIFFLATNKGRLFKKATATLRAFGSGAPAAAAPTATPAPGHAAFGGRTLTANNGHDGAATNPPPPKAGPNFTKPGEGPGPQ